MTMGSAASSQGQKLRQARSSRAPHDWPLAPSSPPPSPRPAPHHTTHLHLTQAPRPPPTGGGRRQAPLHRPARGRDGPRRPRPRRSGSRDWPPQQGEPAHRLSARDCSAETPFPRRCTRRPPRCRRRRRPARCRWSKETKSWRDAWRAAVSTSRVRGTPPPKLAYPATPLRWRSRRSRRPLSWGIAGACAQRVY